MPTMTYLAMRDNHGSGEAPVWFIVGVLVILGILAFSLVVLTVSMVTEEIKERRKKQQAANRNAKREHIDYLVKYNDGSEEGK